MLFDNGVLTCEITGGEIFVHPNANEILDYVCKKFKKVAVLTNGTLMRKESLELLKAYKQKSSSAFLLIVSIPRSMTPLEGEKALLPKLVKR